MGKRRASHEANAPRVLALLGALRAALRTRTDLTLENLALRQQLALLRRRSKRPQFGRLDLTYPPFPSTNYVSPRQRFEYSKGVDPNSELCGLSSL